MACDVHPTALVDDGATLAADVSVGPYAVIGDGVTIAEGSSVGAHAVIQGPTDIGPGNRIHSFACIGGDPQDLKYAGGVTRLSIGEGNTFREFVTVNRGTEGGGALTRIGDRNLFMAYAHVAHDCSVASDTVFANAATLAGHVTVEDFAIVGGLVAIHQHVRIGASAILGGGAMVTLDIPPFCMAAGDRAKLHGLNVVGMRRRGMGEDTVKSVRRAYRTLFQSSLRLTDALTRLREEHADCEEVQYMVGFIERSERGIAR